MKSKRAPWIASVVLAILVAVLFSGGGQPARVGAAAKESYEGLETFTNILSIIQKNYVDDVQTKALIEGAINGMLASLEALIAAAGEGGASAQARRGPS